MSDINFDYRAVDNNGSILAGVINAPDKIEAFRKVTALGLTPLKIKPNRKQRAKRGKKIKRGDIAHFTYQLGVLMAARIPISDGLISIAEQETNPRLKTIIYDIATRIESGEGISQAMAVHTDVFGGVYVETVHAAEQTGNTIKVLEHLSEMLEREQESSSQVRGALMYPACVTLVLLFAVSFLLIFVVPRFATMFAERGVELPMLTQIIVLLGTSAKNYWWLEIPAAAGIFFGFRALKQTPQGKALLDRFLHKIPVLRQILIGAAIGRFTRILGLCLSSGLNLIDALEMAGRASGRPLLMVDAQMLVQQVRSGGRLKDILNDSTYITPFARRMIGAGEESAELPKMCEVVSKHYDREVRQLTKNIGTIIEPVMVVMIAMVVLVIALSIFLPMWNMMSLMK